MAKVNGKKTAKKSISKNKTALVGLGVVLFCVGIMLFALQAKDSIPPALSGNYPSEEDLENPKALGPSQGCRLVGVNYLCDIKITNPKSEPLEWSAVITGLESTTIVEGDSGVVAPNDSMMVKLNVPKSLCDTDSEAKGTVVILEDKHSSNQAETEFQCSPNDDREMEQ